jgi:hypothetical protein
VSVATGQAITGIDISLERARTARITGRMLDAASQPTMGGRVELVPQSASVVSLPVGARISRAGDFEFTNVSAGRYIIRAQNQANNSQTEGEFGMLPVAVNGEDIGGLTLRMSAGSSVSGNVTLETRDPSKPPPASQITLTAVPVDFDTAPPRIAETDVRDDLTFELIGVSGQRRLEVTRTPPGWALKEIFSRRSDVTDRVLQFGQSSQSLSDVEIVLTDRVSELTGAVNDDRGAPAPGAHVIVFSTARDRWYPGSRFMRAAVADASGVYSVAGLPFGTYFVAAVSKLPPYGPDAWQDPEFLASVSRSALEVTIREGEKRSLALVTRQAP